MTAAAATGGGTVALGASVTAGDGRRLDVPVGQPVHFGPEWLQPGVAAAIGGDVGENGGAITIGSGTVNATVVQGC